MYRFSTLPKKKYKVTYKNPKNKIQNWSISSTSCILSCKKSQRKQNKLSTKHSYYTTLFIWNSSKNCIKRQKIPFWYNRMRSNQRISWNTIIRMTEIIRIKEYKDRKNYTSQNKTNKIFRCKIRMKTNSITSTRNTQRIIRCILMQSLKMHNYLSSLYKRKLIMQTKKSILCWIIYTPRTPNQQYLIITYPRYCRQQISYHCSQSFITLFFNPYSLSASTRADSHY